MYELFEIVSSYYKDLCCELHEDNEFIPRVLYFANKVLYLDKIFYNVYNNPKSITRSVNPKKSFDLIKVAQSHVDFMNGKVQEEDLKIQFCAYIGLAINSALDNAKLMDDANRTAFYLELKKNKDLFLFMKRSNNIKYKLEAQLYLISPNLFKMLHSVFLKFN